MAVSATSTDDEVQAQIDNCASYDESGNLVTARSYRTALRIMLGRLSRRAEASSQGDSLKSQLNGLLSEMQAVTNWLNINDTDAANTAIGSSPINVNLQYFKG